MRIALVSPGAYPIPAIRGGSVEIYLDHLSRKLAFRNHTVHLYTSGSPAKFRSKQVHYHPKPGGRPFLQHALTHAVKKAPNIIQIENRPLWVPEAKRRFPNTPVVVNLHSLTYLHAKSGNQKSPLSAMRQADAVVVNSRYMKRSVLQMAPHLKSKIHVIYPGVDTQAFYSRFSEKGRHARQLIRSKFGIGNKPVVLFTGRFIPRKGVHVLLKAMRQVWQSGMVCELWIVGDGGLGAAYRKQIKARAKGLPVRFIGFKAPHELPGYYAAADVFVCPSQRSEAFGLVNLEAAASGLPVLASDAWGIKESVQHGKNGFLIKNWSNSSAWSPLLKKLLRDLDYAEKLGKEGQRLVNAHFTWGHTANGFERLYTSLLK